MWRGFKLCHDHFEGLRILERVEGIVTSESEISVMLSED